MLEFKPDLATTLQRMEAFWQRAVLDRPVVQCTLEKPANEQTPLPLRHHASASERWLDAGYQAELALVQLSNQIFLGDALPVACPNLGPEVLAAFYGCPLAFGDYGTSWSDPIVADWPASGGIALDWQNDYFTKLVELGDALLAVGGDKFIVGMPDWHPGGDLLAALRGPQPLAIDLIENPLAVKTWLARLHPDYFAVYDFWFERIRRAGHPVTSWLPLACEGKYFIPSNDFSALISSKMFREFFLPGLESECQFLDRSIYHLDGPGALRHLDAILSIAKLDAVQWVPGAGREGYSRWVAVYQKIQAAGKGIFVYAQLADLPLVMQTLSPRGLALELTGVASPETAENVFAALARWTRERSVDNHHPPHTAEPFSGEYL